MGLETKKTLAAKIRKLNTSLLIGHPQQFLAQVRQYAV
jgi:hypothetical protein